MKWRVIELETHDAALNMAIDEAVSNSVRENKALPTIRFYKWKPSAVSIGYFQGMNDEVDIGRCKELGIDYVRRRTGGGAVYHDSNGEITYSIIGPESYFPHGVHESYRFICNWIIDGLSNLGINASFVPINDIVVNGKKISGNAQTRSRGILLQHGTILYDLDIRTMFTVLKVSNEKISDKLIKSAEERVTRVLDHSSASRDELYKALLKGFTKDKEYEIDKLNNDELSEAETLAKTVYSNDEWNFSR